MNREDFEKIKELLWKKYRIDSYEESEEGCSCNGKWLSIANILDIIEDELVY